MKPFLNLADLEFTTIQKGPFHTNCAPIGEKIGAKKLSYSMDVVPPGKRVCPYHNHRINEEMFLILEGSGTLRFGGKEYPIQKHDIIACPPGGPDVAHQIINTGSTDLKYLSLSTNERNEVCEYPDSGKIGAFVGDSRDKMEVRLLFKAEQAVDYFEGELPKDV